MNTWPPPNQPAQGKPVGDTATRLSRRAERKTPPAGPEAFAYGSSHFQVQLRARKSDTKWNAKSAATGSSASSHRAYERSRPPLGSPCCPLVTAGSDARRRRVLMVIAHLRNDLPLSARSRGSRSGDHAPTLAKNGKVNRLSLSLGMGLKVPVNRTHAKASAPLYKGAQNAFCQGARNTFATARTRGAKLCLTGL